jgi:hypothetical protein
MCAWVGSRKKIKSKWRIASEAEFGHELEGLAGQKGD